LTAYHIRNATSFTPHECPLPTTVAAAPVPNAVHVIPNATVCRYYSVQSWQHWSGPCHSVATLDRCL